MNKLIYKGNLNDFDIFAGLGIVKGNWNERALKYLHYLGATSSGLNTAQKQIEKANLETLRLDFADQDYAVGSVNTGAVETKDTFDNILTFSRGSTGTYFDSAGVLQTAAVDEPRFTHDPDTLEPMGLLVEEQRTRLNTIAAAPTSPENVTVSAVAHTISFFGTGTVDLTGVATETLIGTGADDRVTLTFTPSAGTLTITPSGAVQNLQLEVGNFETSVILGEGSQVTRSADNCSRTLGSEFNASEGTLVCKFHWDGHDLPSTETLASLSDNNSNVFSNAIVAMPGGNARVRFSDFLDFQNLGSLLVGKNKIAFSYNGESSGTGIAVANGGATFSGEYSNRVSSGMTSLNIGFYATTPLYFNGGLMDVTYSPRALSATELQELTA